MIQAVVLKNRRVFDESCRCVVDRVWPGYSNAFNRHTICHPSVALRESENMPRMLAPVHFVLIAIAGWMNQRQQQMIEYLREENRVLREQLD